MEEIKDDMPKKYEGNANGRKRSHWSRQRLSRKGATNRSSSSHVERMDEMAFLGQTHEFVLGHEEYGGSHPEYISRTADLPSNGKSSSWQARGDRNGSSGRQQGRNQLRRHSRTQAFEDVLDQQERQGEISFIEQLREENRCDDSPKYNPSAFEFQTFEKERPSVLRNHRKDSSRQHCLNQLRSYSRGSSTFPVESCTTNPLITPNPVGEDGFYSSSARYRYGNRQRNPDDTISGAIESSEGNDLPPIESHTRYGNGFDRKQLHRKPLVLCRSRYSSYSSPNEIYSIRDLPSHHGNQFSRSTSLSQNFASRMPATSSDLRHTARAVHLPQQREKEVDSLVSEAIAVRRARARPRSVGRVQVVNIASNARVGCLLPSVETVPDIPYRTRAEEAGQSVQQLSSHPQKRHLPAVTDRILEWTEYDDLSQSTLKLPTTKHGFRSRSNDNPCERQVLSSVLSALVVKNRVSPMTEDDKEQFPDDIPCLRPRRKRKNTVCNKDENGKNTILVKINESRISPHESKADLEGLTKESNNRESILEDSKLQCSQGKKRSNLFFFSFAKFHVMPSYRITTVMSCYVTLIYFFMTCR